MKATLTLESGSVLHLQDVTVNQTGVYAYSSGNPRFGGDGKPQQILTKINVEITGTINKL